MIASKNGGAPLFETVMDRMEDLFRTRQLVPGSKLPPETQLAATLGVSRHTLREVLKALNLFGIIRSRAGDGTYVQRSVSSVFAKAIRLALLLEEAHSLDLLEARLAIEPMLARLAAGKASRPNLVEMRTAIEGMESALGDLDRYLKHEIAFHNAIIKAADNPILRAVMDALSDEMLEARRTITRTETNRQNFRLHLRIYEAIAAGDADAAYAAMSDHLLDNRKHYLNYYSAREATETD